MAPQPPDPIYTFRKSMAQINSLFVTSDNNTELLFACTIQGFLHVWDLKTKREIKCLQICEKECLAIARLNNYFIIQERGVGLKYFGIKDNLDWEIVRTVNCDYNGFCKIIVFNEDIFCPCDNGVIRIYQKNSDSILICQNEDKVNKRGEVMFMKFINYRKGLLVAYESGIVSFWTFNSNNVPRIDCERTFTDTPMCLDFCDITGEGVLGTSGEYLRKFRLDNDINECCSTIITNPGVSSVAIRNDGKLVATGCWDGKIRYFSMKHLKLLVVLDHHKEGAVQFLMFTEDILKSNCEGTLIAAGSDGRISIWDVYTKKKLES
ncbi:hypothetical protein O3M35_011300 [Rhynocoris fuscipes]|uniref:Guanine nucleotide-binding protein subunit beta-like protein 1 n=1 Tax=Rhynocoris fuscipes TaxID=488301 RepID=A0AAW1D070_9HEMI